MGKVKVTLSLDEKKWTDFRVKCLREKKTASQLIQEFIEAHLRNRKQGVA